MFKNREYVLTVYKEGSFTRASEKLFISQPSLSASIKRIEEKLGAPIFDRSTTPISLTEIGEEYVRCAMDIDEREADFLRYISDNTELKSGRIRIGGSSFFSSFVIPALISDFKREHAGIIFEIFEDSTKNLMTKLSLGDLDIVIDNKMLTDEGISAERYATESILLAVPRSLIEKSELLSLGMTREDIKAGKHTECRGVPITAFSQFPFILLNSENDTGKRADKIFKKHGIEPSVLFRLDQQVTAYNISSSGLGISFVSDTLVKRSGASSDLLYFAIDDDLATRSIYFYRKKNRYQPIACRRFIELHAITLSK